MSDSELDRHAKRAYPNYREVLLVAHLNSRGVRGQHSRLFIEQIHIQHYNSLEGKQYIDVYIPWKALTVFGTSMVITNSYSGS